MTSALTIYQPWASLIMSGAKPYEFRRWDYSARFPKLIGERIVIHASARKMVPGEIITLSEQLLFSHEETGLDVDKATDLIVRIRKGIEGTGPELPLPLGAGLGTAVIGKPVRAADLYKFKVADSDRIDQHVWAWPLWNVEIFDEPMPMRGAQGFWRWPRPLPERHAA